MVGRTPEYTGKRIGPAETKLIMLYALIMPATVAPLAALAVLTMAGLAVNQRPHGLTSILVAHDASFANNGLNFAGLNANTAFYNGSTAIAMMLEPYALTIPALLLAGRIARQGRSPSTAGTLPTDSFLFAALLVGMVLVLAGLSHLPALTLGPIAEHRVEAFAEELGRVLEGAQAKAKEGLNQRNKIAETLEDIRDAAGKLLHQLGFDTERTGKSGRLSMRTGS